VRPTLFDIFRETAEMKGQKPIMIYFFWPEEEKVSTAGKACAAFERQLAAAKGFAAVSERFARFTCDANALDKKLRSLYAPTAPRLVVFDPTGKRLAAITRFPSSEKVLVKKFEAVAKACEKQIAKESGKTSEPKTKKKSAPKKKSTRTAKKKGAETEEGGDDAGGDAGDDQKDPDGDEG
jgi:hypothetical protein